MFGNVWWKKKYYITNLNKWIRFCLSLNLDVMNKRVRKRWVFFWFLSTESVIPNQWWITYMFDILMWSVRIYIDHRIYWLSHHHSKSLFYNNLWSKQLLFPCAPLPIRDTKFKVGNKDNNLTYTKQSLFSSLKHLAFKRPRALAPLTQ